MDISVRTKEGSEHFDARLLPSLWNALKKHQCSGRVIDKLISYAPSFYVRSHHDLKVEAKRLLIPYYNCIKVCIVSYLLL
jgi:hypothetical protein